MEDFIIYIILGVLIWWSTKGKSPEWGFRFLLIPILAGIVLTCPATIEGFWSQLKRSIDGTYHAVSPKYLQLYLDEFAFRYNHRDVAVYPVLLERVWKLV